MKLKIIVLVVACVLILSFLFYYFSFREKAINIELDSDNVYGINISGFGSIDLNTNDKGKISKVIKYINLMKCYKNEKYETHNETPDTSVTLLGKDKKIINKIEFYGDLAEYNGEQYKLITQDIHTFYKDIENLCTGINEKQ
jgi:hypothetical protein